VTSTWTRDCPFLASSHFRKVNMPLPACSGSVADQDTLRTIYAIDVLPESFTTCMISVSSALPAFPRIRNYCLIVWPLTNFERLDDRIRSAADMYGVCYATHYTANSSVERVDLCTTSYTSNNATDIATSTHFHAASRYCTRLTPLYRLFIH
jgi:hypothetical protein